MWRAPDRSLFVAGQHGTVLRRGRTGGRWTTLPVHRKILARLEYHRPSFQFLGIAGHDREISSLLDDGNRSESV